MLAPSHPADEGRRLARLRRLAILDTEAESVLDTYTRLAAAGTGMPMALISLVDEDRQWFKSAVGLPQGASTPRSVSFCGHAILGDSVFEVPDATQDERFRDNPLVTGEPRVAHYAGVPLTLSGGERVGTLCVFDLAPGRLTPQQRSLLVELAEGVSDLLKQREQALLGHDSELGTLEALAEHAPVGMFSCDRSGQLVRTNRQWAEIMGLDGAQPAGRDGWMRAIHPDDLPVVASRWARALVEQAPYEGRARLVKNHGNAWIEFRATRPPAGRPGGWPASSRRGRPAARRPAP
ncbi:MAG: GAF domain-containing protein [Comamonadaceae bacterium]|nr:MAG: GAF domain-containing protein [Comamonadaceae bacterium]